MNILIIDDHPLTCQGLAALLGTMQPGARVHSAYSVDRAQAALQKLPAPDWIFLDINLPDDPQHDFFHALCKTQWIDRTVLISAEPEHRLVRSALAAGARGFIPKTAEPDLVRDGFNAVLAGHFYLPETLRNQMRVQPQGMETQRELSPRLSQVQDLLAHGATNKAIARQLGLSAHTVKEYVSSVLAYHSVANRLELVVKLGRDGLT